MRASVAIQVLPAVESDAEVCRIVDEVIAYIASTGVAYEVSPFETVMEDDSYEKLMEIATKCLTIATQVGAPKVSAYLKVVYNPEGEILTIDQKIGKYRK